MENLFDTAPERKSFLGTGWSFPPEFIKNNRCGVQVVSDEEDIWQSLMILFSTSTLERVLRSDYGCNLRDFIFSPLNVSNLTLLEEVIRNNVALHEPRIKLEKLNLTTIENEGKLEILLTYLVRSTNTRFNRVYPFYYQEGTNIEL